MNEVRGDEVIFGVSKHEHTVERLGVVPSPRHHFMASSRDLISRFVRMSALLSEMCVLVGAQG